MFFEGSSFDSPFGPLLDFVSKPFLNNISAKMPTEGAKRRSRGAWRGGGLLQKITALLPHTCRGKADRKVPKDIIGNRGLGLLGFAPVAWSCLGLVGRAWVCLGLLVFAVFFLGLLGFACGLLGFAWFAWGCLGLLTFAWVCMDLLGLAWACLGLLGFA